MDGFAFDLAAHPEVELLTALGRVNVLNDAGDLARRRGERAFQRWTAQNRHEYGRLTSRRCTRT